MKTVLLSCCLVLTAMLAACGGADTPEELFKATSKAALDKDFGKVYDLLCKAAQEDLEKGRTELIKVYEGMLSMSTKDARATAEKKVAEALNKSLGIASLDELKKMDGRKFFIATMEKMVEKQGDKFLEEIRKTEFISAKTSDDGKTATIKYKDSDGKEKTGTAILEDGSWKMGKE